MALGLGLGLGAASIALDSARSFASGRSRGALGSMRSYQDAAIRKGRLGYPKRISPPKMGISSNSRRLMSQSLNSMAIGGSGLFAASFDTSFSIEAMQTQIKALRARYAKYNPDKLAESLRPEPKGSNVDTSA